MSTDRPVLVLGATGGQGGAVSEALARRLLPVRALVRRTDSPAARRLSDRGAELVQGTLDDVEGLAAAMSATSAVFAMTTPFESGTDAEIAQGRNIRAAAGRARVPHLVFSSVASATAHSGVPHFDSKAVIEQVLQAGDTPYTILAPTYFFSRTRWAVRTRSVPGRSSCHYPPTGHCSSSPAGTWASSPPRCSPHRTVTSAGGSSSPATSPRRSGWRQHWVPRSAGTCPTGHTIPRRSGTPTCGRCGPS